MRFISAETIETLAGWTKMPMMLKPLSKSAECKNGGATALRSNRVSVLHLNDSLLKRYTIKMGAALQLFFRKFYERKIWHPPVVAVCIVP
jgi:hypothetical protein